MKDFCKGCSDRYEPDCPLATRSAAAGRVAKNTLRAAGPAFLALGAAASGYVSYFDSPILDKIADERRARVAAIGTCIEMHQAVQQVLTGPDS